MKKVLIILFVILIVSCNRGVCKDRIEIHLSNHTVKQGHTISIFVTSFSRLKSVIAFFNHRKYRFFNIYKNRIFRLFTGIDVAHRPGLVKALVKIITPDDKIIYKRFSFNIKKHVFKQTTVDGRKYKPVVRYNKKMLAILKKRKAIVQDRKYILKKFKTVSAEQLFNKNFIPPTKWLKYKWIWKKKKKFKIARERPVFGAKRVNITKYGKRVRYHRGTDYANIGGTAIVATNSGKVITARHLTAHGKTIVIDHGHGILSVYCHLKKIFVRKGQRVKKAQKIAEMGTTGLSTGNHLHFEIRANGVSVTPEQWFKYGFYIPVFY